MYSFPAGGGVVLRECNVEQMKKNGRVVLLTASPEEVYERVKDSDDRPVLAGRKNVKRYCRIDGGTS